MDQVVLSAFTFTVNGGEDEGKDSVRAYFLDTLLRELDFARSHNTLCFSLDPWVRNHKLYCLGFYGRQHELLR
jgi:hypothetical protein